MRGEQSLTRTLAACHPELPPLARGTAALVWIARPRGGITPACAGNSSPRTAQQATYRNYPRLRGEQIIRFCLGWSGRELPPLARGTGQDTRVFPSDNGITPACAGNSYPFQSMPRWSRNYPRLRGEQAGRSPHPHARWELPPLARGTVLLQLIDPHHHGITPACAGNRHPSRGTAPAPGNYPRLRGEQANRHPQKP